MLMKLHSVPANIAFIGRSTVSEAETRQKIAAHIAENEPFGLGLRAAISIETGEMLGRAGLFRSVIDDVAETELAYLIDHEHWGSGFATEAALGLLRHGFEELGLRRIIANIHPENTGSLRVAEKCGLRFERVLAQYKDFGMVRLFAATNADKTSTA